MEKYIVTKVDNHAPFCQLVTIQNKAGETHVVTLGHSEPEVPVGTTFKVYETIDKRPFALPKAQSYNINGKCYVNIPVQPITLYGVEKFWNELGVLDRVRLHHDVRQALRRQKITPALDRVTNLYLLLGRTVVR